MLSRTTTISGGGECKAFVQQGDGGRSCTGTQAGTGVRRVTAHDGATFLRVICDDKRHNATIMNHNTTKYYVDILYIIWRLYIYMEL